MDAFLEKIKNYYNLDEEGFLALLQKPSFSNIPLIGHDSNAIKAKERIYKAIENKEKILIYGDYDCDGIMSTSIIYYCFLALKKNASFFIPSRYNDGYGLNLENAKRIASKGYSLIICVDNGVSCLEPIKYLKDKGIDVIIIDHHEIGESLPEAISIIHDDLLQYGDIHVSAGYLCFLFSILLLNKVDPYLLVLGAVSTISDVMSIKKYNRELVSIALGLINKNKYETIFNLTSKTYIDEKVLGMEIVPCINAMGRIDKGYKTARLVHYFALDSASLSSDATLASTYNTNRKAMTKNALDNIDIDDSNSSIAILTDLDEGLNGLLATRLEKSLSKPTAIFSPSFKNKDELAGSLRSRPGLDLIEFISTLEDMPLRSGGHSFAAGICIKKEDFPLFASKFEQYSLSHPFIEPKKNEIEISLEDISIENYKKIRMLGPFGHDYEEPKFLVKNIPASILNFNRVGFLSTKLDEKTSLFSFDIKQDIKNKETISLSGKFELNEYKGNFSIRFNCIEAK